MKNGFTVNFKLSFVFLGLFIIFTGGIALFYFGFYNLQKEVKVIDVMAYATGSVAILTLIYHSFSLESSHYFHKENLRIRRNQYSYEVMSKIYEKEMGDNFASLQKIKKENSHILNEKNLSELKIYFNENPEAKSKLSVLLNYFEHVSILVYNKHEDRCKIQ